jgi:uncharacterized protein
MVDPSLIDGRRRRRRRGAQDDSASACDLDGCDIPTCDGCDGCDLPCDLFHLSLLGMIALRVPRRAPRRRVSAPARVGVATIHAYQRFLSARLPTACRHTPTCSEYGLHAVRRYGLATGTRLTADRIARCTATVPFGTADPVP